jgi:hypothetical protein
MVGKGSKSRKGEAGERCECNRMREGGERKGKGRNEREEEGVEERGGDDGEAEG